MRRWWSHVRLVYCLLRKSKATAAVGIGAPAAYGFGFFWSWPSYGKQTAPPVYLWGNNEHGLVAPEVSDSVVRLPTQMLSFEGIHLRSVSAAISHAAAVDSEGNLYQWGDGFSKGLPVCTLKGYALSQVICTEDAVIVFSDYYQRAFIIQLGKSSNSAEHTLAGNAILPVPFESGLSRGERLKKIAAGYDHFVLLGNKGTLLTAALNDRGNVFGQLGCGPSAATKRAGDYSKRIKPPSYEKFMSVFLGRSMDHDEEETIENDRVPSADLFSSFVCKKVELPHGVTPDDVACGDHHTLIKTTDGHAYGFGSNEMLQLGLGPFDRTRLIVPYPVKLPNLAGVSAIAAGGHTSYMVVDTQDQTQIIATGAGLYGQLGNGTWTHTLGTPVPVQKISNMSYYDEQSHSTLPIRCRHISAGSTHVAAVMNTYRPSGEQSSELEIRHGEDVYIWGSNKYYQLGIGGKHHNISKPSTIVPFQLDAPVNINSLSEKFATITKLAGSPLPSLVRTDEVTLSSKMLKLSGPLLTNREETIAFTGGQLQLLSERGREGNGPIQRIYCGPQITIIY